MVNNGEDDPTEIDKINVPVSGFDNKISIDQRQQEQTAAPDTSGIGMNKSTAISANLSQPQKINSEMNSQADINTTGFSNNVSPFYSSFRALFRRQATLLDCLCSESEQAASLSMELGGISK